MYNLVIIFKEGFIITFQQEKIFAVITTLLLVISIYFSDMEELFILQPGAFIVYGAGMFFMWKNIYKKSKELQYKKEKKSYHDL